MLTHPEMRICKKQFKWREIPSCLDRRNSSAFGMTGTLAHFDADMQES